VTASKAPSAAIKEPWVADAACRRPATALPPHVWDDTVHGETELQRKVRIEIAKHVCLVHCPVSAKCEGHAVRYRRKRMGNGVRGGRVFTG
jgi:hypothetical protein